MTNSPNILKNLVPPVAGVLAMMAIGVGYSFFAPAPSSNGDYYHGQSYRNGYGVTVPAPPPAPFPGRQTCINSPYVNDMYTQGITQIKNPDGSGTSITDICNPNIPSSTPGVIKRSCYENPPGSGQYSIREAYIPCANGCANGACLKGSGIPLAGPAFLNGGPSTTFNYPYPLSWMDNGAKFDLTGVSYGLLNLRTNAGQLSGFTLMLKVTNPSSASAIACAPINIKRLLNEEGNLVQPDAEMTTGCYIPAGVTHNNEGVIFVVDPSVRQATFTTGAPSSTFFSITVTASGTITFTNITKQTQG